MESSVGKMRLICWSSKDHFLPGGSFLMLSLLSDMLVDKWHKWARQVFWKKSLCIISLNIFARKWSKTYFYDSWIFFLAQNTFFFFFTSTWDWPSRLVSIFLFLTSFFIMYFHWVSEKYNCSLFQPLLW